MMEKFTASNDSTVEMCGNDRMRVTDNNPRQADSDFVVTPITLTSYLDPNQIDALREFFLHERDQELGRWRWPENPDYVVYPEGTSRLVVRESNGHGLRISLHDRKVIETHLDSYVGAARAYDIAHPEPRPWHDAKPGEVWLLQVGGDDVPAIRDSDEDFFTHSTGYRAIRNNSVAITDGRRIWPEVVSDA